MSLAFKSFIKIFLARHKSLTYLLLKIVVRLHMKSYALAAVFSECYAKEEGHPKHKILAYREWFVNKLQKDWVVLDVGSNNGHMVEFMAPYCRFVYGIEIAEDLVREAWGKRGGENVEYICADATRFDYSAIKGVDCITLSNVLEHIEDRIGFLQKLVNSVPWTAKKNGRLLVRVPLLERDWLPVFVKRVGLNYRLDPTHYTEYWVDDFFSEVQEAGLWVEESHVRFGELYAVCRICDTVCS